MAINIAAQQQLAQPVSAFFEGRALQRAEQESSLRMRALENAEGRAASAETRAQEGHDIEKRAAEVKFDEITGKKALAGAQQVLAIPKGQRKAFVEKNFPELVQKLSEQEYGWDEVDEDEIDEMAKGIAARASADLGMAPEKIEPLSTEGKVATDVKRGILTPQQGASALAPKNTTDFDNFLASQKDPEFAQFLKDKRSKGLSMTLPDGTVISMGGEGGGVDPAELKSPVVAKLQDSIVAATDEMDRLNSIGRGFDPQYLQVPGRLKGTALKVKDLAGGMLGDMTPQETEYLEKFSTFKADAAKNLSSILNRLSGAAISPAEAERLKKGVPNDEDSPTAFVAKYKAEVKDTSRAIMRANWALKNGIGVKSVDQLSKVMPLGSIDQVYEDRANELWQELGGTKEAKAEAVRRANQEFGLAK